MNKLLKKDVILHVRVPADLHELLKRYADALRISPSEAVRLLLSTPLNNFKSQLE